jgi:heme-degrading monooxygenase HmoA
MIRHIVIINFKKNNRDYLALLEKTRPILADIKGLLSYKLYKNESSYTPKNVISIGVEILFEDHKAYDLFMKHPKHYEANKIFEQYLAEPPYMVLTHQL